MTYLQHVNEGGFARPIPKSPEDEEIILVLFKTLNTDRNIIIPVRRRYSWWNKRNLRQNPNLIQCIHNCRTRSSHPNISSEADERIVVPPHSFTCFLSQHNSASPYLQFSSYSTMVYENMQEQCYDI
jgi:hypothetical protein